MAMEPQSRNGASGVKERLERGRDELTHLRDDFSELAADVRVLAEKELELARAEMGEQMKLAVQGAIWGVVTAVLGLVLLTFVFVSTMLVLNEFMRLWLAAVITTAIVLGLAALAGLYAYSRFKQLTGVPKRTINSVREDVKWARNQLSLSGR